MTYMENKIELKTIRDLLGMKFFIPSYQRGYRWTEQQVKDLLNDIWEFSQKENKSIGEFYCLQPLVVKGKLEDVLTQIKTASTIEQVKSLLKGSWEVIDGQQRLTTIFVLLSFLRCEKQYTLSYETRKEFQEFLDLIQKEENTNSTYDAIVMNKKEWNNIDFYHIFIAYRTIQGWFYPDKENESLKTFQETLLNKVKFIWYESVDENPVKVFRRLNSGKIGLTDSELIKALMLNRANFGQETDDHLKLRQQEIASEWDNIEYTLQNDEFWLFLRNIEENDKYEHSTRIDFIFDMICEQDSLEIFREDDKKKTNNGNMDNSIGTDEHRTFRYFYKYFQNGIIDEEEKVKTCWEIVKKYFHTFQEWYNDLELYHYVGYLIHLHQGEILDGLFKLWNNKSSKEYFIFELKSKVKDEIKNCKDLSKQYEIDGQPKKTTCKPLLLLHNIQSIIKQNNLLKSKEEYKLAVFYKFPFHIFKKEKWDVEHIDSNTSNDLEKPKDQKEWLKYTVLGAVLDDELKKKIKSFIQDKNSGISFEELTNEIEKLSTSSWTNPEQDKNKAWNFVLLDAGTNRGYGNSIFPAKRRCIIGKDQGKYYIIDDELNVSKKDGAIAFIPPVTKNVFLKYYNTSVDSLREWNENDALAYKQNILDTLQEFGVIDSSNNQNKENNEQ